MKRKTKGEITIEAALVVPILIVIVVSLIYFAMYVHDVLIIKSYAYSAGIDNILFDIGKFEKKIEEKIKRSPVLITESNIKCYEQDSSYIIEITNKNARGLSILTGLIVKESWKIKICSGKNRKDMYVIRGLIDLVK